MRIFLVRHGESEGNLSREIYRTLPDHKIPLSEAGYAQAEAAGDFLRTWLTAHPSAGLTRVWFSPYARTHEPGWYEAEPNPLNCSIRLLEGTGTEEYADRGYIFAGFPKRPEVLRTERSG